MGVSDRQLTGTPVGTYKQDFVLYTGAGSGGGGGLTVSNTQRNTTMIDLNPFDTLLREFTVQNSTFQIFSDSGGLNQQPLYFAVYGSNDYPTRNILTEAAGNNLKFTATPPYNIAITNINLVPLTNDQKVTVAGAQAAVNFYTDQGNNIYTRGYTDRGVTTYYGFTYGNNNKAVQPFVPVTSRLVRFDFGSIFVGSNIGGSPTNYNDHTIYSDIIIELWDFNKQVIYSETVSRFAASSPKPGNTPILPVPYIDNYSTVVADDGQTYWTILYGVKFEPPATLAVVPGQTYYIVMKKATNGATNSHGVACNVDSGFYRDYSRGEYIFGNLSFASYTGTSLTTQTDTGGNTIQMIFCTIRDTPRVALTAAWDSSAYYWYNPASNVNQMKVLKLDAERRI